MKKFLPYLLSLLFFILLAGGYWYFLRNNSINKLKTNQSTNNTLEDYYKAGQELAKKDGTTEATFFAVGDIMLSRNVAGSMAKNGKDANYPFRNMALELTKTDFNFGNLESPFSGKDDYNPTGSLVFNAPTWTLPGLLNNNFQVLNLANNHGFDQGLKGLLYTKKLLEDNKVTTLGTGNNLDEAWQGKVYTAKGIKIGFIGASFSTLNDGGKVTNNNVARIENTTRLVQAINDLKTRSDFIVATMHAGTEYTRTPNAAQIAFAHAAIDAGADIVIGAHPHWVQTIENYKGKEIFYSLGNFVFDQEWSQETKEGLTLKITLTKPGGCGANTSSANAATDIAGSTSSACGSDVQGNPIAASIKQIELIPIILENYSTPRVATEIEKQNIFKKINVTTNVITP